MTYLLIRDYILQIILYDPDLCHRLQRFQAEFDTNK